MAKRYDPIMCMMVDEPAKAQDAKAKDESYIVRGRKYKVVKRDVDNVTVLGPDGKVTKMDIDFVMIERKKVSDSASTLDKAIKTCDAVDVDRISNYLWLWVEGREVASMLFNEGLDKYSGPHDREHKDEAYDFAKKYAQKELDTLYSKLKSSVEKKLKEGYTNTKNIISSAK